MQQSTFARGRATFLFVLFALQSLSALAFDLGRVPDGYPNGRSDAPYGTYCTPYASGCKKIGDELEFLARKVHGLGTFTGKDEVLQAEAAFHLEHRLLRVYRYILELPAETLTPFERHSQLNRALRLYKMVRTHAGRHYQSMVRTIDVAFPGPNGGQFRRELRDGAALYEMNCRRETCPTEKEQRSFFEEKLAKFLKTGSRNEMYRLDAAALAKLPTIARLEYVERENGEVWVTEGKAGHVLLSEGGRVRAAGQLVIVKDPAGKIALLVASNTSGNYKPDLHSVNLLLQKLQAEFRIPLGATLATEGEPIGTQTVSVFMKAFKQPQEAIQAKVGEMEAEAKAILTSVAPSWTPGGDCRGFFGKLLGR